MDQEVISDGSRAGLALNSAPIVARGMLIFGVSLGVSYPGGCFIIGLDAATGQEKLALQHDRAARSARR